MLLSIIELFFSIKLRNHYNTTSYNHNITSFSSQLYNDGHTEAAIQLEMTALQVLYFKTNLLKYTLMNCSSFNFKILDKKNKNIKDHSSLSPSVAC